MPHFSQMAQNLILACSSGKMAQSTKDNTMASSQEREDTKSPMETTTMDNGKLTSFMDMVSNSTSSETAR